MPRRRQLLLTLPAVLSWLAAGRLAVSARAAHVGALRFRLLHPGHGIGLDVGVGVGG